jgi:hypothetical protein
MVSLEDDVKSDRSHERSVWVAASTGFWMIFLAVVDLLLICWTDRVELRLDIKQDYIVDIQRDIILFCSFSTDTVYESINSSDL